MLARTGIAGLAVMALLVTATSVSAMDFNPGKWEITSTVEIPGAPASPPPYVSRQCMTKDEPVPHKTAGDQDCKVLGWKPSGNTITWTMECKAHGSSMKTTGSMTYTGNTFKGTMKTLLGPEAGNMIITTNLNGKRLGPCN